LLIWEVAVDEHSKDMLELQKMLSGYDWYYAFSDDHSVWVAGTAASDRIKAQVKKCGRDGERLLQAHMDIHFGPHTGFSYQYEEIPA
jgi:hypothetical protein